MNIAADLTKEGKCNTTNNDLLLSNCKLGRIQKNLVIWQTTKVQVKPTLYLKSLTDNFSNILT